jgi:hypothetical protein
MAIDPGETGTSKERSEMKRNETTGTGRRLGATTLALVAAGLTAAAFAAFSIAESGDDNGGRDRIAPAPFAAPVPPGGPGAYAPSEADREALEAFRQCMEDQGVEPPPRPSGDVPPEPPSEKEMDGVQAAIERCESELPEGARHVPLPPPCHHEDGEGKREQA